MYVCDTHPTAQQPEPNFITNHFNCVPELQLIMCAVARYYDISSEADRGMETF